MSKKLRDISDSELNDFGALVNRIVDLIRKEWDWKDFKPIGYTEYLKTYEDYDDTPVKQPDYFKGIIDDTVTCFPFWESISMPHVAYDDTSQGRDPLNTIIAAAIRLGMNIQGERARRRDKEDEIIFIPVMQTIFHDPPESYGNCLWACIASVTGIPLKEFPTGKDPDWVITMCKILDKHGYSFEGCLEDPKEITTYEGIDGYVVIGGASPRGVKAGHAVVYYKGKMIHDPHPDGTGILDLKEAYMIERSK